LTVFLSRTVLAFNSARWFRIAGCLTGMSPHKGTFMFLEHTDYYIELSRREKDFFEDFGKAPFFFNIVDFPVDKKESIVFLQNWSNFDGNVVRTK
jgi:hypothetical protein